MNLDTNFKNEAELVAFKAFLKVMKMHGLYFPVITEMYRLVATRSGDMTEYRDTKIPMAKNMPIPEGVFTQGINWQALHERIIFRVENNITSMGGHGMCADEKNNFLIHCVNTMIQLFVEFPLSKSHNHGFTKKVPKFEILGQEVYNYASKRLFGNDFVDTSSANNDDVAVPQNEEESKFVAEMFNMFITEKHMPMNEAVRATTMELAKFRAKKNGNNSVLNGGDFYVTQEDFDEDLWDDPNDADNDPYYGYDDEDEEW